MKMARKKQTKIKSFKINRNEMAYGIIEELEKRKVDFSKLIKNLLVSEFINKKEFKTAKIKRLLNQRKELQKKVPEISNQLQDNEKKLNKLGYKLK